jgi:hypothetical protein
MTDKQREVNKRLTEAWKERVTINLNPKKLKELQKGKAIEVVVNYKWYVVQPQENPKVFDASGKQLDKAALKKLLKKMV